MISPDVIDEAVRLLVSDGRPTRIILFGSYARGEALEESDLDFLVVLPQVTSRLAEMVRLRGLLRPLRLVAGVLVYSEEQLHDWGAVPGTVVFEALNEGRVLYAGA